MQPDPTKTLQPCRNCGRVLPLAEFYKNTTYTSGYDTSCKTCRLAYTARRKEAHGDEIRARQREFYVQHRQEILDYQKNHHQVNAVAISKRNREYYAEHRELMSERRKAFLRDYKEHVHERCRKYYLANREVLDRRTAERRAKDPARWKQYLVEWNRQNPDHYRVASAKRRAASKGCPGIHSKEQLRALLSAQGGKCAACAKDITTKSHADHVMPLKLGGSNGIANIQLLCPQCNLRKGAKHPDVWERELRLRERHGRGK